MSTAVEQPRLLETYSASIDALDASGSHPAAAVEALRQLLNIIREVIGPGVTVTVAATTLGVSRQTVSKWADAGKLKTVSGKRRLIQTDDLVRVSREVNRLRDLGENRQLLATAFHNLSTRGTDSLFPGIRESLEAVAEGDYVEIDVGELAEKAGGSGTAKS